MKRLLVLIVFLAAVSTACSGGLGSYAAKVDGNVITAAEIEHEMRVLADNPETARSLDANLASSGGLRPGGDNTINTAYASQVVSARILGVLFDKEISRLGLTVDDAARAKAENQLRESQGAAAFDAFPQEYRNYTIDRQAQLDSILSFRTSEPELRKYYDANSADFNETCVSYIVVATQAEAEQVRSDVEGGQSFATLANERSLDSPVRQGGQPTDGVLGCLLQSEFSQLPAPFQQAVQRTEAGQVTEPINLQGAYFIAQPTSKRQIPFNEARERVAERFGSPDQLFAELAQGSDIEVNPRYGQYVAPSAGAGGGTSLVTPRTPYSLQPREDASQTPANNIFGGAVPQSQS